MAESANRPVLSETPLHALVVDDDPDINRLLRARLAARGYAVASVANGDEALAWLSHNTTDLLFLDVSMPGTGGLEVLDQIRAEVRDTVVIMTTAFGSEQVVIDALRRGADDYLRKPFDPPEFKAVLERTVSRLLLNRQNTALRKQLDEKRSQLEAELARAADVQAGLLPRSTPNIPGFDIAAECVPALEVGGDFYDWEEPEPGMLALRLCDVMGKGMPAALLMATVRAVMRAVVRSSSPAAALRYVAAVLEQDFALADSFVTLFMAQLDSVTRTVVYVDAGHGHAFVRRACGDVALLTPRSLPLGVMPDEPYVEGTIVLDPGDALVIYSDGLIDARPDLDLDHHTLARYLEGAGSALAMIDRLVTLLAPVGIPPDDVTVVVVRCVHT